MIIGFLGLGKMGSRLAGKAASAGHQVLAWNRSAESVTKLTAQFPSIKGFSTTSQLLEKLPSPRLLWMMLPAGEATELVFKEIFPYLAQGDIVVDGGNSHFSDTERRAKELTQKGIRFLGIGVSGGIIAEKTGYPFMVGGDKSAYEEIKPILNDLSKPQGGHFYFGPAGAGHFVKMIHNGIEYGFMQSLAEGLSILEKAPYQLNLVSVVNLWQKGTLVSGFMLDRAAEVLTSDPQLTGIIGAVAESGEAGWTVNEAQKEGVEVPIIAASLAYRQKSQIDPEVQKSFTARFLSALRAAFGGHPVQKIL